MLAGMVLLCYTLTGTKQVTYVILFLLFNFIMLGLPVIHNLFIIFLYRTYYPDKNIPRAIEILNIAFNIICILDVLIFIFTAVTFSTHRYPENLKQEAYMTLSLAMFLCITLTVQVIGSFRLIRIVKENAQLQLEDSFV